ncbi:MAG: H-X9-DG-CTERM domain-containing protein, partial [Planctomycetota bacterium]
ADTDDRLGWMFVGSPGANSARSMELGFGSAHPGAFSAVMGDGSVKSIPLTATPSVLLSLGRRNDGVSVDPESL